MLIDLAAFHCPVCRTRLVEDGRLPSLGCSACRVQYPLLGSLPVLVPDPMGHLCRSLAAASSKRRAGRAALGQVESARKEGDNGVSPAVTDLLASALRRDLELLDEQRAVLLHHTSARARALSRAQALHGGILRRIGFRSGWLPSWASRATPTAYDFDAALHHLWADWARTDAGEAQIATVLRHVAASTERYCRPTDTALYLGAGLGRYAFDGGGLFSSVIALELSLAAGLLLTKLRRAPIEFSLLNWQGPASDEELVEVHQATFPREPFGANVRYVVADALSLPLADESVDAVVSVFFTDVARASRLFPEVRRVLRPGGRFIHVGPLYYHFEDKSERFSHAGLRRVMERSYGFAFAEDDATFELPYMDAVGSLRLVFRVWSFVATKL